MKIREFIKMEIDIDVYDDVCEELGIAFCGPLELTEEGEKKFAEVMDYDIDVHIDPRRVYFDCAVVKCDDAEEKVWKRKLRKAKEFFDSAAGMCAWDDYEKWFKEVG